MRVLFRPLAVAIPTSADQYHFASVAESALVDHFGIPACALELTEVAVETLGTLQSTTTSEIFGTWPVIYSRAGTTGQKYRSGKHYSILQC